MIGCGGTDVFGGGTVVDCGGMVVDCGGIVVVFAHVLALVFFCPSPIIVLYFVTIAIVPLYCMCVFL